jgi:hypothetical protein
MYYQETFFSEASLTHIASFSFNPDLIESTEPSFRTQRLLSRHPISVELFAAIP